MTDLPGSVVIVVPCYNEFRRLNVNAFRAFADRRPNLTFLFVNDGSTDQTAELIDRLRDSAPRSFATIHLPCNCGKAEAVRRGMGQAFLTDAKYVGFWDADLATPLEMIDVFCSALSRRPEIEIVFGSRLSLLGHHIHRSAFRGLVGRTFAFVASLLLGLRIRDTQCGAKLFRPSLITRAVFRQPFLSRWIFDVEIVGRVANACRYSRTPHVKNIIYECPLDQWCEMSGGSLKAGDLCRAITDLVAVYLHYLRPGAPRHALSDGDQSSNRYDGDEMTLRKEPDARHGRAA